MRPPEPPGLGSMNGSRFEAKEGLKENGLVWRLEDDNWLVGFFPTHLKNII